MIDDEIRTSAVADLPKRVQGFAQQAAIRNSDQPPLPPRASAQFSFTAQACSAAWIAPSKSPFRKTASASRARASASFERGVLRRDAGLSGPAVALRWPPLGRFQAEP